VGSPEHQFSRKEKPPILQSFDKTVPLSISGSHSPAGSGRAPFCGLGRWAPSSRSGDVAGGRAGFDTHKIEKGNPL
jgi:hypothetical protein